VGGQRTPTPPQIKPDSYTVFNAGMPSSRAVLPVLGWCAATLASIALASVALLPVLRTGTPRGSDLAAGVSIAEPPADAVTAPAPSGSGPSASSSPRPASPGATRSAPPTVIDGWTVTTDGDGKRVYVRSFRVDGGTAVIRMTEDRVYLLTATPNPGYRVETTQNEPGNLAVQFIQQNHFFVIHAVWHNNGPFAEVSEVGS
jgi:hypothetical protein